MPRYYSEPGTVVVCRQCKKEFAPKWYKWFCSRKCYLKGKKKPLSKRFWDNVDKNGPVPAHMPHLGNCWIFGGKRFGKSVKEDSYGNCKDDEGNPIKAHRAAWELTNGVIPNELILLHKCDTKRCVRLSHLQLGTNADNSKDMVEKNRQTHGSKCHTARFTEEQVLEIRRRYANGETQLSMVKEFGVAKNTIWRIINRLHWDHI